MSSIRSLDSFRDCIYFPGMGGVRKRERYELAIKDTTPYVALMSLYGSKYGTKEWKQLTLTNTKIGIYSYYIRNYVEARGHALQNAGNPAEGSEEWRRIVAPTMEEYDEDDRLAEAQHECDRNAAENAARAAAPAFAALSFEDMVTLCPYVPRALERSMWRTITSLVPPEMVAAVEKKSRDNQLAYEAECTKREHYAERMERKYGERYTF